MQLEGYERAGQMEERSVSGWTICPRPSYRISSGMTASDRAQLESQTRAERTLVSGRVSRSGVCTVYAPACNQIWAKVIQGCRGPCLGALLCRDEATSDSACSTRLAAIDVA